MEERILDPFIGLLLVLIGAGSLYLLIPRLRDKWIEWREIKSEKEMLAVRLELRALGADFAPVANVSTTAPLLSGQDWLRKFARDWVSEHHTAHETGE